VVKPPTPQELHERTMWQARNVHEYGSGWHPRRSSIAWRIWRRGRTVAVGYGRRAVQRVLDRIWGLPW